jgi:hypothetical protein
MRACVHSVDQSQTQTDSGPGVPQWSPQSIYIVLLNFFFFCDRLLRHYDVAALFVNEYITSSNIFSISVPNDAYVTFERFANLFDARTPN